ncbi:hypothetical protein SFRURICE_006286 [Spodoptera frugiperda]|nr:hypothetical protein SFRURICE_006286 [Spodoptera frugiperda]
MNKCKLNTNNTVALSSTEAEYMGISDCATRLQLLTITVLLKFNPASNSAFRYIKRIQSQSRNVDKSNVNVKCFKCKQFGHFMNKCKLNTNNTVALSSTEAEYMGISDCATRLQLLTITVLLKFNPASNSAFRYIKRM